MGFRARWLATKHRDRADVLDALKFVVEAESDAVHDTGLHAVEVGEWVVVVGDGWDFMDLVTRRAAARLSNRGEVLFFYTDDTPMKAELTSFTEGQVNWSIVYDGESGPTRPSTEGTLPGDAKERIAAAVKAQRETTDDADHVYGVLADVGEAVVGFRHDLTLGEGKHRPVYQLKPA